MLLKKSDVGISSCGDAIIKQKTIADFIRIFEIEEVNNGDDVSIVAQKLYKYLKESCKNINVSFYVSGYKKDEPFVFVINHNLIERKNIDSKNNITYGAAWNGEYEAIDRIIKSKPETQINYYLMPLKDAVDFSEFLVDLVIKYQRFEDRVATCGGSIDLLVITKDYAKFLRHKILNPKQK